MRLQRVQHAVLQRQLVAMAFAPLCLRFLLACRQIVSFVHANALGPPWMEMLLRMNHLVGSEQLLQLMLLILIFID